MEYQNIAYTEEYQNHRKKFDYLFDDKYKCDDSRAITILDGKFCLIINYYSDPSYQVFKYNVSTSKTEIYDTEGKKITEFRNVDHHVDFYSVVEHSNGRHYLFFSIDLYGYSVMDLSNFNTYHYIPKESFSDLGETFIWTKVLYCKVNNIIAVDGCIWAFPYGTEFYDFSVPEEFPYKLIYTSHEMDGEIDINSDVTPLRWTEDGKIVLECCLNKDEPTIEKTIDIEWRYLKKLKGTDVLSVSE